MEITSELHGAETHSAHLPFGWLHRRECTHSPELFAKLFAQGQFKQTLWIKGGERAGLAEQVELWVELRSARVSIAGKIAPV